MTSQFRRCHWLHGNRRSKRPSAILFFDTEAAIDAPNDRLQEHTFRLAAGTFCVYTPLDGLVERESKIFVDPLEFWAWVEILALTYPELVLVAHNIDYDARVARAFHYLPHNGWTPAWCVMSQSCTLFEFHRDDNKITLLDGLNLFPMALADLGKSVGLDKGSVDFEAVSDAELADYCSNDVRILVAAWRRWLDFLDKHDLGNFGVTIAGQAWNAYRHKYMPAQIGIHGNPDAIELERAAYRGGRTECYFVGDPPRGTYYKLDVNALYAAMMDAFPFPRRLVRVIGNVDAAYLTRLLDDYLVVAELLLDSDEARYPAVVGDRTCYPVGRFAATLATPEVRTALRKRHVVGVGRVALYEPSDLFSEYVQHMAALRSEYQDRGDYASSKMAKLLVNALQGKFGQRGHKQKIIGKAPIDTVDVLYWHDGESNTSGVDWTFGGVVIRQWTDGEHFDSFPAIPAHVCAYGRDHMQSLFDVAGRHNVYYTDTDSLIVNQAGYARLQNQICDGVPGLLKIEGVCEDLEIRARKDYRFGDSEVVKGIRSDATRLAPNVYEQWHFTRLRYAFQSHRLEGVRLHKVRKELKRTVTAGVIGRDGWLQPPRATLTTYDLARLEPLSSNDRMWTWQIDPGFVKRLSRSESVQRSLKVWVRWNQAPGSPDAASARLPESTSYAPLAF